VIRNLQYLLLYNDIVFYEVLAEAIITSFQILFLFSEKKDLYLTAEFLGTLCTQSNTLSLKQGLKNILWGCYNCPSNT